MDLLPESCANHTARDMLDDIVTLVRTRRRQSTITPRDRTPSTLLSQSDIELIESRVIQVKRLLRIQDNLCYLLNERRTNEDNTPPRRVSTPSSLPRLQRDDVTNDLEADSCVYDATPYTYRKRDPTIRQVAVGRNNMAASEQYPDGPIRRRSSRDPVGAQSFAGRAPTVCVEADATDRRQLSSVTVTSSRGTRLATPVGRYGANDLVEKLMAQNARLKTALRHITAQQYGSTHDYLTMQEYEDVITQLRHDVQQWRHRSESFRSLVVAKSRNDAAERLSHKCLELSEKVCQLERTLQVKQTLLSALLNDVTDDQSRDSRGAITSSTSSSDERPTKIFPVSTCDVAVDCGTSLISLESVDIVRPPSLLPWATTESEARQITPSRSGGTTAKEALMCPRCERQFDDERRYGNHCIRCTDE